MAVAAGTAIIKPPVVYSFPSVIRIASRREQEWVTLNNDIDFGMLVPQGVQWIGPAAYKIVFLLAGSVKGVE